MNASLMPEDSPSIFRQDPSPEVDKEWRRITEFGYLIITGDDIRRMGQDPANAVKASPEWGFGHEDRYISQIDVFHQMHCVDVLRQALYFNHDYYFTSAVNDTEKLNPIHHAHIGHCLHVITENIMCSGVVDVFPFMWVEGSRRPFPDFNINHKCRDFEALLEFQIKNTVPDTNKKANYMVRPKDAKVFPMPDSYWKTMGQKKPEWKDGLPLDGVPTA